jgi:hypothetical protein
MECREGGRRLRFEALFEHGAGERLASKTVEKFHSPGLTKRDSLGKTAF